MWKPEATVGPAWGGGGQEMAISQTSQDLFKILRLWELPNLQKLNNGKRQLTNEVICKKMAISLACN